MSLYLNERFRKFNNELTIKFNDVIHKEEEAKIALDYLESRGIGKDLIDKYSIGYCPKDISLKGKESLSGSIIFPIIDEDGNTVAFSRRIPKKKEEIDDDVPHWFHESFPKSFYFYGLNVAINYIMERNSVFIVEGQCDVISCHKYGFQNTVGTMGTSLTKEHIVKLLRFTSNFILMFDGDKAGNEATERTKELIKELYSDIIKVKTVPLYIGENKYDPDSFLKKFGKNPILKHLKKIKEI